MTLANSQDYELALSRLGYVWRCLHCPYAPERTYSGDEIDNAITRHFAENHGELLGGAA